jgi:hypothetical protein
MIIVLRKLSEVSMYTIEKKQCLEFAGLFMVGWLVIDPAS